MVFVNAEKMGDVATTGDVQKMAELLRAKGWEVTIGEGRDEFENETEADRFESDWDEALAIIGE